MPFLKRLGYFLIGLSIGLLFLAVFLRKKTEGTDTEFCYLPNCRVLKELRSKPMEVDPALGYTPDTLLIRHLLTEGDVVFGESDTKAVPCKLYKVRGKKGNNSLSIVLENCDSITRLREYQLQQD
jgi:hypothetical protein